ncbi:DUF2249 domain-containing protein [Thermoflavifilum thermophilum]|uniref:DUF2249 domain-containing protein n=1 Tax=Thermoflavifilum thermophilum TaxID=1393122 RepID=A0A1I7MYZ1_9BACT|nr:DUF2249 domain-containing protein [Thermoflavifilum thermophilum]SFV27621.1 protein of unknown function [Thermoflavifilum thermophilum]
MVVHARTRIASIIREKPEAINVIAGLAKPLEKLKNPLLRKLFASRVTVADAAAMGGCSVEAFREALEKMGFQWVDDQEIRIEPSLHDIPPWLKQIQEQQVVHMDVRETLQQGKDPLQDILKAYEKIQPGGILCIINTFEPVPLIQLLGKKGAESHTIAKSQDLFYTYFLKPASASVDLLQTDDDTPAVIYCNQQKWEELLQQYPEHKRRFLDVRALEMPQPMQTILAALPDLKPGDALLVQHKRVPVYLLEELHDAHYRTYIYKISETEVWLLIVQIAKNG